MEVSTILLFSLLLCGIKAIHADDSLAALATRVRLVEGEIHAWKLTVFNTEIKLMNKFEVLESSLKEERTGRFLIPLIKPLVKLAIREIMKGDYIGNIITGHVLDEVQSLNTSVLNTKTELQSLKQQLRRVERDRDTYRKCLRKQRRRLTKDIRTFQLHLNQTVADLGENARMLTSKLKKTNHDLCDTKQKVNVLTGDIYTLNTSSVMMRNEVESCVDGLQEIRLKLPIDIQSLTSQLNQTKEDLLDTKEVVNSLTEDVMTLNVSCGIRKQIRSSDGNRSSLRTLSSSQLSHTTLTTTFAGTTAASTGPNPSSTVPPTPVMTQDSDLQASTTDLSEDLTSSKRVPPTPVTTLDSVTHATPSPECFLYAASEDGDLESVKRILDAGHIDINSRGQYSWTPVMVAAEYGRRDVVEFLVGRGADVSLVDRDRDNILHLACWSGDLGTVKLILSLDAVDINARNNHGWTAADVARRHGHQRVLDLLVSHGAH